MTNIIDKKNKKIATLDGLRGISIIAVMGFHGSWPFFSGGGRGVDLFFVISGFLITSLLIKERETLGAINIGNFYWRRALRIIPAYFIFLVGYFLICQFVFTDFKDRLTESLVTAGLYSTNFMIGWFNRDVLVAHTWSLSLEEQFYFLYPAMLIFLNKRASLILSVLLLLSALIWRCFLYLSMGGVIENPYRFFYSPDTRFDTIIFGCVAALLLSDQGIKEKLKPLFSRVDVLCACVVLLVINFFISEAVEPFKYTFSFSVNSVCFVGILLYAILGNHSSAVNRLLQMNVLQLIGCLSYSLYLWHPVSLGLAGRVATKVGPGLMLVTNTISYILISLFFACISYFVIEKPFLKLKDRFSLVQATWKS